MPTWVLWALEYWWAIAVAIVVLLFGFIAFVVWWGTREMPIDRPDMDME